MNRESDSATEVGKARLPVRILLLGLAAALFILAASHAGAETWRMRYVTAESSETSVKPSQDELDEVQLTVRDEGLDPAEITRPAGRFLLSVDNRSGVERLTLTLRRETGEHIRDIEVPKHATDWAEQIDLAAGSYVLSEATHPEWVCRIIIR